MKETRTQRRRRLHAGWTEEDLRREEDDIFARTLHMLRQDAEIDRLRRERTKNATAKVKSKGDRHRERAAQLRAEGLSAARIGVRVAAEEHRPDPYPERTVRKWLAPRKG